LGIGSTSLTNSSLNVSKTITGSTTSIGIIQGGVVQSGVTSNAYGFYNSATTQAAAFTLGTYIHYGADQSTIGSGSAITTQIGYNAAATLIGATNNYGFQGGIPAGTNRWNLFMNGTANNFMAGSLGIGSTSLTGYSLRLNKQLTGNTDVYGVANTAQAQSTATTTVRSFYSLIGTQATAYTLGDLMHYWAEQDTIGAGSTVTRQYGYYVHSSLIGATNNYGFFGNIASGTNRWNLYMNGTAANYMAGALAIGGTTINTNTLLQINGSASTSTLLQMSGNSNQNQIAVVDNANTGTSAQASYRLSIDAGIASFNVYSNAFATTEFQSSALLSSGIMTGGLFLNTAANTPIIIRTNGVQRARFKGTGQMRFVPLTADPSGAESGDVYYNSTISALKLYDGTVWRTITVI
jgi:hypothetical protein